MDLNSVQKNQCPIKIFQGINSIGLCALWTNNYIKNCKPYNLRHQKNTTSYSITALSNTMNNKLEEIGMVELKLVNKLIMKSEITQLEPSPRPSTNLQGKHSCIYNLYMTHREFATHPRTLLIWNWAKTKQKWNSSKCDLSWLVNSPSAGGRFGYNGVWIRAPPFLPRSKELLLLYYIKVPKIFVY